MRSTLEPIWGETFTFGVSSLYTQMLRVRLMDSDSLLGNKHLVADDALGSVTVALAAEVAVEGRDDGRGPSDLVVSCWRPVEGDRGSLQLALELKERGL